MDNTPAPSTRVHRSGIILCCRDMGSDWQSGQYADLAVKLTEQSSRRVAVCSQLYSAESIASEIEILVKEGAEQITFLPLSILPLKTTGAVSYVVSWALRKWPELKFEIAPQLTWNDMTRWVENTVATALKAMSVMPESSSLILCGPGHEEPLLNADLARLAQLLYESTRISRIQPAFLNGVRPTLGEVATSISQSEIQNLIVVAWKLTESATDSVRTLCTQIAESSGKKVQILQMELQHPAIVNLLVANLLEAAPFESKEVAGEPDTSSLLTAQEEYELEQLSQRIDSMLPSEYRGQYEDVAPRSMGSAQLKYGEDGLIAWDQIWTSFCDLALAGGPPHRGKLLEAVTSEEARSAPEEYSKVVNEIRRGIELVTHLRTFESPVLGWVGIQCADEEMAAWLMRAIIVENVMVRREGANLFLPAGPHFTVTKEVKNVITSVAKTVHYWTSHLKFRQQGRQ